MKKLIVLLSLAFTLAFTFSCGNGNKDAENADSTKVADTMVLTTNASTDGLITVTAKFKNAGSLEGDADIIFVKEDGSEIVFYRNMMSPTEPELKYMFIGDDGASPNSKLVGKTFIIKYKINPKGRLSMISGEEEPCNQIMSAEIK
jgi:hypothetical protein